MELEVETKITLKLAAEHYVHGRAMLRLDAHDIEKLTGYAADPGITSAHIKGAAAKALQEAFNIVSSEVLDELTANIEEIE